MSHAFFRFYSNLNDFLPPHRQQVEFTHQIKNPGSIKDAIEALGIPHPEINLILVNGESVSFKYLVQTGDHISVYPQFATLDITAISQVQPPPLSEIRFVLDVHLGKLATYLRLLGFDTLYRNDYHDQELAQISCQEQRILLTQDRGLLKRSIITYGYVVRSDDPEQQLVEIFKRFQLYALIDPFQRCPRCNGELALVEKAAIQNQIPYYTRLYYDHFAQCESCHQIYWKGAHYQRIQSLLDWVKVQDMTPTV